MATYNPYASSSLGSPASPNFLHTKEPSYMKDPSFHIEPVTPHDQSFFNLSGNASNKRKIPGAGIYRTLSGILGFKEKASLGLFIVFGGAMIGFCLYHIQMFSPAIMERLTIPGEWFWYRQKMFHENYAIHIYLSVLGGIFVMLQFLPAIRRRAMIYHRLNGYLSLLMLIPANVCGAVAGNKAFGGEINAQSAYYTLGVLAVGCFVLGIVNVKSNTREHRKWMIRGVSIFAVGLTTRLIVLCARQIVTDIGNYHSLFRCDELMDVLTNTSEVAKRFPGCINVDISATWVPVLADARSDDLGFGSATRVTQGMALWFAMMTHILGCEAYLRSTDEANYHRRDYVLEPRHDDANVNLGPYPMAI